MKSLLILCCSLFMVSLYAQLIEPAYKNLDYVGDGLVRHQMDIYIPRGLYRPAPAIVYIHGGAWLAGQKGSAMDFLDELYNQGYVIADINYRLSQDSIFPAQIYDCKTAIRYLKTHAARFRVDTSRVGVIGHSAGGHLAALLGTSENEPAFEGLHLGSPEANSRVHAVMDFFGPTDFLQMDHHLPRTAPDSCSDYLVHEKVDSPESLLVGCPITDCTDRVWAANPISYVNGNEPPFAIHHGNFDCTVSPHQSILLYQSLQAQNADVSLDLYPGVGHGGPFFQSTAMKQRIDQFFDAKLRRKGIAPSRQYPAYWAWNGNPIMLLGGTKDDNLFQQPSLETHLDSLVMAGGNFVRNTMSSRDPGNVWPFEKVGALYDLKRFNPEYWDRFERFLQLTAARRIVVQIEIWATFDYYRDNWAVNPFNPKNNSNYTAAEVKLPVEVSSHPVVAENDFFRSVPTQHNNLKLLPYQQAFVDKILEHTLRYDHVLYCIDNETAVPANWPMFWARYIQSKAVERGKTVYVTEMWDPWDLSHPMHDVTLQHPELFAYTDVSQNNHRSGQAHYEQGMRYRNRMRALGLIRPINNVKIYGGQGRYGTESDGVERFWRSAFMGMAAVRFHRPPTGIGLNATAQNSIKSLKELFTAIPFFEFEPTPELLAGQEENEAYCFASPGDGYAIYFADGGQVILEDEALPGQVELKWLDIATATWSDVETVNTRGSLILNAPGSGSWVALVTSLPPAN